MLDQDLRHFISVYLLVVGAVLPIVNPIGSAPMFLALTRGADGETRASLARGVAINSFALLLGSLVFGNFVLRLFGLSIPVVQLAGGLVLCWLGAKLLTDEPPAMPASNSSANQEMITRAFYPLTLPLTVDPGAISVAVTLGANHSHNVETVLVALAAGVSATITIAITVWLAYRYAERVSHWLGHSRMMVVLRLSAFIVLCIGVQIAWNGVRGLLEELPFVAPQTAAPPASPKP
jgi:multiple antibiotic resistance protein